MRYDNWKIVFMEQRMRGTVGVWLEPLVVLRAPKLFNLRSDPFKRADTTSNTYWDWFMDRIYLMVPAQGIVGEFLQTSCSSRRQKAASFTIDRCRPRSRQPRGRALVWGDEPERDGQRLANYWHGDFPWRAAPGYGHTTPVRSFPANGFGLYDMAGNVWEWTTSWYAARHPEPVDTGMSHIGFRWVLRGE